MAEEGWVAPLGPRVRPDLQVQQVRPVPKETLVSQGLKEKLVRPVLRVKLASLVTRGQQELQEPQELKEKLVRLERPARLVQPVLWVQQDLQGPDPVLALAPSSGSSWRYLQGMPTT